MNALFAPETRQNGKAASNGVLTRAVASGEPLGAIAATYDYVSDDGELLFQVMRFEPKAFRQRRPDGRGGWTYSLDNVRRVLYCQPEVIEAVALGKTIFIVEGEKDVECLRSLGIATTCNAGGAGKWRTEYSDTLRDADVVILPDNDEAGRKHATQVADSLAAIARRVLVLELPGLAAKGDVSDWIAEGNTADQLNALVDDAPEVDECLTRHIEKSRELLVENSADQEAKSLRFRLLTERELSEIVLPPPLVEGVLGQGGMSAIVAPYSTFKSFIGLSLGLSVAHGFEWYGHAVTAGVVVYQTGEGASGLYHRIEAWRQLNGIPPDCGNIHFLPQSLKLNDARDLNDLLAALSCLPDRPSLLTIDTLARSLRGNENSADDTGLYVEALDAIRETAGAHVQLIHHTGWEGTRSRGSSNIPASLDTEITLSRDGDRVTVTCTKMKDGAEFSPITLESVPLAGSLAFRALAVTSPKLSQNERTALEVLHATAKLSATTWKTRTGIAERSFYRCVNRLRSLGYVRISDKGYEVTEAGANAI